jgi:hypothetical protein
MYNFWLITPLICATLAHNEGLTPRFAAAHYFPPGALDGSLLERAAFAAPNPQSGCNIGWVHCGSTSCMPSGSSCCSSGGFCPPGYYCDSGGCCETGQVCSGPALGCPDGTRLCGAYCIANSATCSTPGGGGGTTATCAAGKEVCGTGCMPIGANCCDSGYYCNAGNYCSGDYCYASTATQTTRGLNT